jgi:hypothetical protein
MIYDLLGQQRSILGMVLALFNCAMQNVPACPAYRQAGGRQGLGIERQRSEKKTE